MGNLENELLLNTINEHKIMKKRFLILILFFAPLLLFSQKPTKLESLQSLYLELYKGGVKLGCATGFIIKSETQYYLVTNYHVVTNKRPDNGGWLDPATPISPDKIKIQCIAKDLNSYTVIEESLVDNNGTPRWHENNVGSEKVDVIELPLIDTANVKFHPVNYKSSAYDSVLFTPTERIFILGFPLGLKSDQDLPIWKSGLIASEPDFDQEGKPILWIDAITFPGMSGAPVYFMSKEMLRLKNGQSAIISGPSKFMGVFSHSNKLQVYGALWKASFLEKIFDNLP